MAGDPGGGELLKEKGEEEFMVAPVQFNRQGANPRWEPFSVAALKDLGKAAKDFRQESSYFKSVLRATLDGSILVPADLKSIFSNLLDENEFIVWERKWKQELKELLPIYENNPWKNFLTINHLAGEGDFRKGQEQADVLPPSVLEDIKKVAKRVFSQMPTAGVPSAKYALVKQEPGETFSAFVKRVRAVVSRKIQGAEAHEETILSVAISNEMRPVKGKSRLFLQSPS